jgi:3-oxoacyl-[acyl-carrier-protein] synthase-3
MIRCGDIKRALVIGADTLSRVTDPHDRDGMIYADGAGAVVLEARESAAPVGVLSHVVRTDAVDHSALLTMGPSYGELPGLAERFLKMEGRKVYKYAVQTVPGAIRAALAKAGIPLGGVAKILLHQANGKLDEAVLHALFAQAGEGEPPPGIMPMTIASLGNSSVATLPTLLDLLCSGQLDGHRVGPGDVVVLASVGAGMHANAVVYRFPA